MDTGKQKGICLCSEPGKVSTRKAFPAFFFFKLKSRWTVHLGPVSVQMVIPPSDYFSIVSLSRNSSTGRLPGDTGSPDAAVTVHVS